MKWNWQNKKRLNEKKLNGKKALIVSACLCICGIAFTACGKREITDGNPEENSAENLTASETNGTSDEAIIGIPERVEDTIGVITIDADVISEGYGSQPTVIMKPDTFEEEDIKQYAEAVFDEGSAEVVLPYKYCSKNFLMNEQAKIEAQIKELGYTEETVLDIPDYMYLGYQLTDIKKCIENNDESEVKENDGSYQWIEARYTNQEDVPMDMLTCQIKGKIEGKDYAMYFIKTDTSDGPYSIMCIFKITEMHYAEELDILDIEPYPISPDASESDKINTCVLTEEEAASQAEAFAGKLGIEGYVVAAVYPAQQHIWHYGGDGEVLQNNPFTKGYLVYLGREMGGCTIPPLYPFLETNCLENTGTRQEGIIALVTDEGIERFQYVNTMEMSEVTTENTTVMDFQDIQKIASDYLKSETDEYVIDKIRLCMGLVRDAKTDEYAYIPVWCYEYNPGWSPIYANRCAYMFSAIDGSVIDANSGYTLWPNK